MKSNTDVTGWRGSLWTGIGCSLRAPSTAVFRPIVGVAKSKPKNVVDILMIVALVVAGMIAVADGLSQGSIKEREVYWNGSLEYRPCAGTVWFAAASLLLMFLSVRKAQAALAEGLFLWFLFYTAAYTRDFAYIRSPGITLFVTEAVLGILFLWYVLVSRSKRTRLPHVALAWILALAEIAFCFCGAANLLLESPFRASLFWAFIGLGVSRTHLLDRERLCREVFNASSQ